MSGINLNECYGIAMGHRLQFEEAQQAWVVLYPEGMVQLNQSAAEILNRCDGETPLEQVITDLEQVYGETGLTRDVVELVTAALDQGWLRRL